MFFLSLVVETPVSSSPIYTSHSVSQYEANDFGMLDLLRTASGQVMMKLKDGS